MKKSIERRKTGGEEGGKRKYCLSAAYESRANTAKSANVAKIAKGADWAKMADLVDRGGGELIEVQNLRRDRDRAEVWRTAPLPLKLRDDGWMPLASVNPGDESGAERVLLSRGDMLAVMAKGNGGICGGIAGGEVSILGRLAAEPIAVEQVGADLLRIYLRNAPAEYVAVDSGLLTLLGRMPRMPEVSFGIAATSRLSEPLGWLKLSGGGTISGSRLRRSDIAIISRKALDSYRAVIAEAHERGYFVQPVLVRVRFEDREGATIETGPPVVMCYGGFQCCGAITARSEDSLATLSGGAWTATGWMMKATMSGGVAPAWRRRIGAMVVEALDDFDLTDEDACSAVSAQQSGSGYDVALRLPGVADTDAANLQRQKAVVAEGLRQCGRGARWREHFRAILPFDSDRREFTVSYSRTETREVAATRTERRDSVSYGTIFRQHDTFAGGSLSVERSEGFSLRQFAVAQDTASTGSWEGAAIATVDGREAHPCRWTLASGATPSLLSPALIFPDERATSLSLYLKSAGKVRSLTVPLTPLAGTGMAVWIADDLLPVSLTESAETTLPAITPAGGADHYPSAVEIAIGLSPGSRGNRIVDIGAGEIVRICQAPRANSSWDFSRLRLLIAGTDGTRLLTLATGGRIHALARLDSRPVLSPRCIAEVAGNRGIEVIALAGGDLLRYSSRGTELLLAGATPGETGEAVGYDRRFDEIWISAATGIRRFAAREGYREAVKVAGLPAGAAIFREWSGELLMTIGESGVYSCGNAETGSVETILRRRHHIDSYASIYELRCFASEASGTIALLGDNGTRIPGTLTRLAVEGALNAPILLAAAAAARRWIEEDYRLTLPADGEIHPMRTA